MAFLFGGKNRQKSPAEIVKSLKDLLFKLREPTVNPKVGQRRDGKSSASDKATTQVEEDAAKHMSQMKLIVQGTPG